jgi:acetolactate synthase-1/2/3 large subunit
MGMHGEAWVNNAIQEADLLIALGMRFDDRVTGNLKTYARTRRRFTSTSIAPRLNKNVRVDVASRRIFARRSTNGCRWSSRRPRRVG